MIEKTVFLNNDEIKKVIKDNYGIEIFNIVKIDRGSANIYELNDRQYILKDFQSEYTFEEINKEIIVINYLKDRGIKVPKYIQCLNGNYSLIYKWKNIIIQEYIEGYTIEQNSGNYDQTIESATYLGLIVRELEDCLYQFNKCNVIEWCGINKFEESINKYYDIIKQLDLSNKTDLIIKKDMEDKIEMINYFKNNISLSQIEKITSKNSHGDYSIMQFIYKDEKINAIVDFVSASNIPIVWEIIRSYSYIDKEAKDGIFNINTLVDYVKEFCKYVKLNEYDLKYMPYIYLIQLLNSTYGYKQFLNNRNNIDLLSFGILRTNICRYLYNNAEKISSILIDEVNYN